MFWKKESKADRPDINWYNLTSIDQLQSIKKESESQPVLIYKHSTRCGISSMVLGRLEREWTEELGGMKSYFLDLISYREVSNAIQEVFGVYHESPQVILIKDGKAVYNASHMAISAEALKSNQ
ncbi:MAG: bacillithiol system redox-active protein YtxJ [Cytophagia bacterium]|nr:bacillithiol system redox-active protein YtxJ [Cytophagia bacterium]